MATRNISSEDWFPMCAEVPFAFMFVFTYIYIFTIELLINSSLVSSVLISSYIYSGRGLGVGVWFAFHSHCRSHDSITVSSAWELTSVSMRYSQGDGVNTSLSRISYCTHAHCIRLCFSVYISVLSWYIGLPAARSCAPWDNNNKDNI